MSYLSSQELFNCYVTMTPVARSSCQPTWKPGVSENGAALQQAWEEHSIELPWELGSVCQILVKGDEYVYVVSNIFEATSCVE
jgi:hypothetical protein